MISKATEVRLDPESRAVLEGWVRASTTEQRKVKRARIVLLAAEGWASRRIAREIGVMTGVVSVWRKRFAASSIEGLEDKPRPGAKPVYTQETDKRILATLDQPAPKGRARWDGKLVAKALGDVDVNYVRRFLRKQKIDLAGRKSWCESKDPEFAAKAADVVGLYMAPPENAVVLCIDEKPSIQALERSQGYLKLPNGRALTGHSHDYKRHGTSTLFAAFEVGPPTRNAGGARSSWSSWTMSLPPIRRRGSKSSWTISTPIRRMRNGWNAIRWSRSTTRQRARPG